MKSDSAIPVTRVVAERVKNYIFQSLENMINLKVSIEMTMLRIDQHTSKLIESEFLAVRSVETWNKCYD